MPGTEKEAFNAARIGRGRQLRPLPRFQLLDLPL